MTDYFEDAEKDDDIRNAHQLITYAFSNNMHDEAIAVCNILSKKWKHRTDLFDTWKEQIRCNRNSNNFNNHIFGLLKKEDSYIIFITKKDVWVEEQCCDDTISSDIYNLLNRNNIYKKQDGVYEYKKKIGTKDLINFMEDLGFQHNQDFEDFMIDGEEEDQEYI